MRRRIFSLTLPAHAESRLLPEDFVSLTIDTSLLLGGHWWGPSKEMRNGVAADRTGALDLDDPLLRSYARALAPAVLRIGGTEADRVWYRLGRKAARSFGFDDPDAAFPDPQARRHELVIDKRLWKKLHDFLSASSFSFLFTVSAGPADRDGDGAWIDANARKLIAYSVKKGLPVAAWELGNEVNGFPFIHGWKHRVSPARYARDFIRFAELVKFLDPKAKAVGPASAVWPVIGEPNPIIPRLCASAAAPHLDAVSWHFYPTQSSNGRLAVRRTGPLTTLSPRVLDSCLRWNRRVMKAVSRANRRRPENAPCENWVTESAHALYGGESGVSDAFASTLWWLDELGLLAREGASKVFRQSLVGARYGLLDQDTRSPRPDYYATFLWKRLMGCRALAIEAPAGPDRKLRAYCHEDGERRTLLLINLHASVAAELALPGFAAAESYLLQGAGGLSGKTLLVNGVVASDELVFAWRKKRVRKAYRVDAYSAGSEHSVPPLSALFLVSAANAV